MSFEAIKAEIDANASWHKKQIAKSFAELRNKGHLDITKMMLQILKQSENCGTITIRKPYTYQPAGLQKSDNVQ